MRGGGSLPPLYYMNKLIEQLTIEAFFDEQTNEPGQKMYIFGEEKMQKFAQLIVKECDRYVAEHYDQMEPWTNSGHLLKHFGIEQQE